MLVIKRDKKVEPFDVNKIDAAITKAFNAVNEPIDSDILQDIKDELYINNIVSVEELQDQLEKALMVCDYYDVAKAFILYRRKRAESRALNEKKQFIKDYAKAKNAATGSKYDANANVTEKNIVTLNGELFKGDVIKVNRAILTDKIRELYGEELAKEYIRMLEQHLLYKHDETSIMPYCVAITMYPFLLEGLQPIGGLSARPKNLDSFCGMFVNLVFAISSQFAGAVATYTIESLMHDGKALQSGTSHNFGDGFARAFGIQYTDKENKLQYVHQTSWGMTTRMIGAIIMVHGDNSGLVLPPRIAPVQAVIIPIQQRKEGVLEKADEMFAALKAAGVRVKVDDTDKSPGFKFAEQEMRGIPIRIECGPKDIENGQAVICRRDTREKYTVTFDELVEKVQEILETIQKDMLERARKHRDSHTYVATNYEEFKDTIVNKPGFVKAMWCGDRACEDKIKEDVQATSRCMPFEQEHLSDVCVCCGKPAKKMVYWGRAY